MTFITDVFEDYFSKKNKMSKSNTLCHFDNKYEVRSENEGLWTHINYLTFKKTFEELEKKEDKFFIIVETGCSAHGTQSTILFDKFVNYYDGYVFSVDKERSRVCDTQSRVSLKTIVVCADSLHFLTTFNKPIDLLYLDSFDVDWRNQENSSQHHYKEFNLVRTMLSKNSLLLIDDSPKDLTWLDINKNNRKYEMIKQIFSNNKYNGKGAIICQELENSEFKLLLHQYQILWKLS